MKTIILESLSSLLKVKSMFLNVETITIGTFALIHEGHTIILKKMKRTTNHSCLIALRYPKMNYCFSNKSIEMALEQKINVLVFVQMKATDFSISKNDFVYLIGKAFPNLKEIVSGEDWKFGNKRKGTIDDFKLINIKIKAIKTLINKKQKISSKEIMNNLQKFDNFNDSVKLLISKPSLKGIVIRGKRNGHKLGFPTANINIPKNNYFNLPNGIYFTKTLVNEKLYDSITNVGKAPTFGLDDLTKIETHILDFEKDIYDQEIEVFFYKLHNYERKHQSIQELIDFIKKMIDDRRKYIK